MFVLISVRLRVTEVMCCQQYSYYKKCSEDTLLLCFANKFINTLYALSTCIVCKFFSSCFLSTIGPLKIGYGVDYVGLCVVAASERM